MSALFSVPGVVQEQARQVAEAEARGAGKDEEDTGRGCVQSGRTAGPVATDVVQLQRRRLVRLGGRISLRRSHLHRVNF